MGFLAILIGVFQNAELVFGTRFAVLFLIRYTPSVIELQVFANTEGTSSRSMTDFSFPRRPYSFSSCYSIHAGILYVVMDRTFIQTYI